MKDRSFALMCLYGSAFIRFLFVLDFIGVFYIVCYMCLCQQFV